ncbi:hypothetical protein BN59_00828 [Legionella massiliensis]|uniref:Uncharacterized protein n=1 Tax=Legionella massiliensis TaxID=1034943 RepID=A0A078KXS2_9GAMM|nr:hypothetical protein [Legionella massiliensis]CDZ76554.1 hypothetical protein BN59_00828 [Legionella massiliensis]CEE12292.1 hypothetical protein BN1094_00828 [Legionella massiliensis]
MSFHRPKITLAALFISLCPLMANADDTTTTNTTTTTTAPAANTSAPASSGDSNKQESFETICISSWMKRLNDVQDKVSYKNFGEKYCACALTQPLDTDAAVDKAIQVCMSRILLHDAMDAVEDEIGLDKATDKDVNQYCQDRWKLIYPQMSEQAQQNTNAFCTCAQPKLMTLINSSDGMTDKEYYAQIDSVAASCSSEVKPAQNSSSPSSN